MHKIFIDGTFLAKLCPRDRPNTINIDGIMRCCRLDKACAEGHLNDADLTQCCDSLYDQDDTTCEGHVCLDCK